MAGRIMKLIFYLIFVEFHSVCAVNYSNDKSSLVFVFDTTGSMFNDLKQLREGAEMILKTALEESNIIADFVFVPFHDPAVGPPTVTTHKEVFKSALNIVRVYGGGDCPERSLGGLQLALKVSRPRSFVYVFTDATASDHRLVGKVLDSVQRKQSQIVFVLTGHCNDLNKPSYQVYEQIATASSGQVFNLNKTSVHKVLEFVRSSIRGRTVNLGSSVNPPGYNYTQQIPVDKTVGEVTVSVSGAKPSIKVVKPSGEELTGPPQLVTILDLSEIMIVKVLSPEPGPWRVTVGSSEPHSVRVKGLSELSFTHGFSVTDVTSLNHTSYRPLKGTYNNMLISLPANTSIKLDHAELLDLKGKPLFEIPLKKIDATSNVYKADAYIPPEEFFNIAVVGVDSSGNEVRRSSPTAVSAAPPDIPSVTVPKKIVSHPHSRVVLPCAVDSVVPVTVVWTRRGVDLHEHTHSLRSTTAEYVIKDVSEADVGTYRCVASNAAGRATAETSVDMIALPPQVTVTPTNVTVTETERVLLTCSIYSETYLHRARIEFQGDLKHYDIKLEPSIDGYYTLNRTIEEAKQNDSGIYTCIAANRGGVSNQSTELTVVPKPTALILGPHTLTKLLHSDIQLVCHVENAVTVIWTYNDITVASNEVNGNYNDVMNVDNVKEDGVWTCSANKGTYSASDSVQVTVHIKPEVSIVGSKNVSLPRNSTYDVVCTVVARPQPRVLWHKETEEFLYHVLTNPEPNLYRSVLTVNGTNGTYFCIGENSEGIHQDSVDINVYSPMILERQLNDTTVELYSPVKFHCQISAYPKPNIKWRHNDTHVTRDDNVAVDNDVLIIKRVDFDNLGVYLCEADNGYEKITVNFSLGLHGLAKPLIYKEHEKIVVRTGETLNLTCRILSGNPKPDITWRFKSSTNFTSLIDTSLKNYTVVIENVNKNNTGAYRCEASNVIGEDVHELTVSVQYPPELHSDQEAYKMQGPQQVRMGDAISLNCNVTGDPLPLVTWTKNGLPINYSKNTHLHGDTLVIESATKFDSGVFVCNASNVLGFTSRNFTIIVYAPPVVTSSGAELEVLEGELVELPCEVKGQPEPRVKWTHNGQDIIDRRRHRDGYGLRFIANLTDFGDYRCLASNDFGNSSLNYTLYIWVTPSIEESEEEVITIEKGWNVSVECNAVGFPIPVISWKFNNVDLKENTSNVRFNNVGSLSVTNSSVASRGVYTCCAENIAGAAFKNYIINVNEAPYFLTDNFTGPYIASTLDKTLALSCNVAGDPRPFVYWSKDGIGLNVDSRFAVDTEGTLIMKNPTEDLSGVYTCTAINIAGNASRDVDVQIYSPPILMRDQTSPLITTAIEGTSVAVTCPVRGNVTVKWYKNAILISNETLKFSNISRTNASSHTCVATNMMGSIHTDVIVDVQWPPKIQDGGDVEILAGNDCFIDCKTDANPHAEIKWLFNSKALMGENKEKLSILDAKAYNSGVYRCVASNVHGTVFKDTRLQVIEPPFISMFDYLEVELKSGTNASLDCKATGTPPPKVAWTYNNTNWVLQNTSLISIDTTILSEGLFTCKASNKAGTRSIVYRVVVIVSPVIEEVISFVGGEGRVVGEIEEIEVGTNTRIACKASGNPSPIIQWLHNGNIVSNETGLYADLILTNVTSLNKGEYVCVASNIGGVDQKRIKIDVLEPPRIFQTLFYNANSSQANVTLAVLCNQVYHLHCHPYGNPLPDVYWFKDGVPLKFYDDEMLSTDFGEIIVSKGAKYEQSGNYTCVARNKVGNASVSFFVDVLVPPPPQKGEIKRVKTLSGLSLNISCPVEGHPLPFIKWIKQPYAEIVESTRTLLLDYNSTLHFPNIDTSDSGLYSCIATNSVGTTELLYEVTVQTAPTIAGNDSQLVVALGRSIILKCEVAGVPEPKITWFKDVQRLGPPLASVQSLSHTSVACVWDSALRHSGSYSCVAENDAGVAHRRYTVNIRVPGKWSSWSPWSYCNVTCGPGYQRRDRRCQYLDDRNNTIDRNNKPENVLIDESSCRGSSVDRRKCRMPPCESPSPMWSHWSSWSPCSSSCEPAVQLRTRTCLHDDCDGDHVQVRKCPGVPKCETNRLHYTIGDDLEDENIPDYIPEATFELQPEATDVTKPKLSKPFKKKPIPASPVYEVTVTENLDGSQRGPCETGDWFDADNNKCEDVDECVTSRSVCHSTQVCVNTRGGYSCTCEKGYTSLGAGQRCIDVNECTLDVHECEYACVNTAGGYVCACPAPLRLHRDRRRCVTPSLQHEPVQYEDYEDTKTFYKYL